MASDDRFYQLDFRNRPVLKGDIGSLLKIDGLLVSGGGAAAALLLPNSAQGLERSAYALSVEEWSEYLAYSDNPQLLMPDKAFVRKVRYDISGAVQQKIWVADHFACMYCNRKMGEVQLTIDHYIPLELSGVNDQSNYLSACRRCNKGKGCQHPKEWKGTANRYEQFLEYLRLRKVQ